MSLSDGSVSLVVGTIPLSSLKVDTQQRETVSETSSTGVLLLSSLPSHLTSLFYITLRILGIIQCKYQILLFETEILSSEDGQSYLWCTVFCFVFQFQAQRIGTYSLHT